VCHFKAVEGNSSIYKPTGDPLCNSSAPLGHTVTTLDEGRCSLSLQQNGDNCPDVRHTLLGKDTGTEEAGPQQQESVFSTPRLETVKCF